METNFTDEDPSLSVGELLLATVLCTGVALFGVWGALLGEHHSELNYLPRLGDGFLLSLAMLSLVFFILAFVLSLPIIAIANIIRCARLPSHYHRLGIGVIITMAVTVSVRKWAISVDELLLVPFGIMAICAVAIGAFGADLLTTPKKTQSNSGIKIALYGVLVTLSFILNAIYVGTVYEPARLPLFGDSDFMAARLVSEEYDDFHKWPMEKKIASASAIVYTSAKASPDGIVREYVVDVLKNTPISSFDNKPGEQFLYPMGSSKSQDAPGCGSLLFFVGDFYRPWFSTPVENQRLSRHEQYSLEHIQTIAGLNLKKDDFSKKERSNPKNESELADAVGKVWGIEIATASPRRQAEIAFTSGAPEFLAFYYCPNDDACEGLTLGLTSNTKCYASKFGTKVETYAYDYNSGDVKYSLKNVSPDAWYSGLHFSSSYNRHLAMLLEDNGVKCD